MDTEFERLVSVLIEGNHCYECGTLLLIDPTDLDDEGDRSYTSEYSCPGCVAEFLISIEDHETLLILEYTRIDEEAPEELIAPFQRKSKESLQHQAHPVKDLLQGYIELNAGLTLMWENRMRITEACDLLREGGVHNHGEEFDHRLVAWLVPLLHARRERKTFKTAESV